MSLHQDLRTPQAALHALLVELFSADELRRWLRHGPDADLIPELPGEAMPLTDLVDRMLTALERRGRIGVGFFERLEAERPQMKAAIAAVTERWSRPSEGSRNTAAPASESAALALSAGAPSQTIHHHYYGPAPVSTDSSPAERGPAAYPPPRTMEIARGLGFAWLAGALVLLWTIAIAYSGGQIAALEKSMFSFMPSRFQRFGYLAAAGLVLAAAGVRRIWSASDTRRARNGGLRRKDR